MIPKPQKPCWPYRHFNISLKSDEGVSYCITKASRNSTMYILQNAIPQNNIGDVPNFFVSGVIWSVPNYRKGLTYNI